MLPYIPYYFATASQVKYYEPLIQDYAGGIAIYDKLIKGTNGETVDINQYTFEMANTYEIPRDDVVITLSWNNISGTILAPDTYRFGGT